MGMRERVSRIGDLVSQQGQVLIYHQVGRKSADPVHVSVPEEVFSAQMETLHEKCNPISLDQMMQALEGGDLPPRAVAVTFDDGYAAVLECALPILRKWKIPATVFLPAGLLGGRVEFWWDELQRLIWEAEGEPTDWSWLAQDIRMRLRPQTAREDAYHILQESMRVLSPDAILAEIERFRKAAKVLQKEARPDVRPLSWEEADVLASEPLITLGAHTMRHPWLAALGTADQRAELEGSRREVESRLGKPVHWLAYPFGGRDSETLETLRLTQETGFTFACANVKGGVRGSSDRYWIPRVPPGDAAGVEFYRRLEQYYFSSGSPRVPKGYAGPVKRIRAHGMAVDGRRLGRLPRAGLGWVGSRLRRAFSKPVNAVL